ncbi:MAG: 50S ribosomal protein L3 [Polyangiaceae bacterium]|nr:50S ribosomal protein L3 [Polyangiaceae bacterium]
MNIHPGVLCRKVGMTQIIESDGTIIPVTVVRANSVIVGKRTEEVDGYNAIIFGLDERKEKHTSKPLAGFYKKAGVSAKRDIREFRCSAEDVAAAEVGAAADIASIFEEGQFVDVQATSKGKGFAGVMKRHNFAGAKASHGSHEYKRHGGSIGTNMTPGRVFKGKKMPGQMGNKTVSVLNQKIAKIVADDSLVLIKGTIPGGKNSLVMLKGAVKKHGGKKA